MTKGRYKIFTFKLYDYIRKNISKKARKRPNQLQLLSFVFFFCACLKLSRKERKIRKDVCLNFVVIITESFKMSKQLRPDQSIQRKTNYHLKIIWLVSEIADCNI